MSRLFALFLIASLCMGFDIFAAGDTAEVRPDSWAAVDGLGRTVSTYDDVGETRDGKYVGIFYWTWHYDFARSTRARNVTEIINEHPEARNDYNHSAWGRGTGGQYFFWDKPIFDYYINTDEYVVREQAELLADAGVDVIFFDCTNGTFVWEPAYETVFKVFEEARAQGVKTPQIAFMMNFGGAQDTATQLEYVYKDIYKPGRYEDLWFKWDGKPLVLARKKSTTYAGDMSTELRKFFTFRYCNPSYYTQDQPISQGQWGWCSVYPQTKYGVRDDGSVEQMTVSVAQNASDNGGPIAMNDYRGGVYGRGYAKGDYSYTYTYQGQEIKVDKNTQDAYLYGLNFQQQWDYAMSVDPDFIFITGWNEWVAIRQQSWQGTTNAFADQYNAEFSRDVEPSDGVLKDFFYYQMVDNIRKFKGVGKNPYSGTDAGVYKTIDIHSSSDQWADVELRYDHYQNNTWDRDSNGWLGMKRMTYSTMRNDFVSFKVAYDDEYVYFLAETADNITSSSGVSWMHLYIDTDPTGISPNWEGFEYVVNRIPLTTPEWAGYCKVDSSAGGWKFREVGRAEYTVNGKRMQIAIPRAMLGLEDVNGTMPAFNFKWSDNTVAPGATSDSGNILDFYKYGDVAPGGRFMFTFDPAEFGTKGDVNADGSINVADASLVMQILAEWDMPEGTVVSNADINGNGKVDVQDATLILQHIAGWFDEFPV